jgi:hypothetical protein
MCMRARVCVRERERGVGEELSLISFFPTPMCFIISYSTIMFDLWLCDFCPLSQEHN